MKALFEAEVKRNNVYPLRPPFAKFRAAAMDEKLRGIDGTFEYTDGALRIPERLAPPVVGRVHNHCAAGQL